MSITTARFRASMPKRVVVSRPHRPVTQRLQTITPNAKSPLKNAFRDKMRNAKALRVNRNPKLKRDAVQAQRTAKQKAQLRQAQKNAASKRSH